MDFFLTMVYLLLLTEASGAENASVGTGSVSPPQARQVASLGSSLTLNCSFDREDGVDRIRVSWLLGETPHLDCQDKTLKRLSTGLANQTMQQETGGNYVQVTGDTWSSLTLRDVTSQYNGWYFCHVVVEIPALRNRCINVTQVIISEYGRSAEESASSLSSSPSTRTTVTPPSPSLPLHGNVGWWLLVAVSAGSLILLGVIVSIWIICRRKTCRSTENPIYENMHSVIKNTALSQPSPQIGTQNS
ncbi:hypothetical protein AAFF_G00005140 [Aldrovandia affinis]|uniref:Ig-like domain-containing protein n=1 Tax=Aldrovandia affinis TaxID=143900 RepID=A0AAD7TDI4_9TELE|nr:hypothetical protein AAFF_G00005140 [Aldrovandia affinis]